MASLGDIDSVPCYIQYFEPSSYGFESTYYSYDSFTFTDISDTFTSDMLDRADFPILFICSFCIAVITVFIINQITKLFCKGGIFGSFS